MKPKIFKSDSICPHCGSQNTRLDFDYPDTMSCCESCLCDFITETGEIILNPAEVV